MDVIREERSTLRAAERRWHKSKNSLDLDKHHSLLKSFSAHITDAKTHYFLNKITLPQEIRKITNNLIYHKKELEKKIQTKPKVNRRKEITKVKNEIKQRLKKPDRKSVV